MSGDPEQDYFADGMVEDIITGLSRIKWLFVIARNSSFVYKGKAVDVRQVGRELGVRYRRWRAACVSPARRLRVTGQLVEARNGRASSGPTSSTASSKDVFDLQDRMTDSVVGIIEPSVRRSEIERSRRKRPESLDAYDSLPARLALMATSLTMAGGHHAAAAKLLRDALETGPRT